MSKWSICLVVATAASFADTVTLRDGKTIEGTFVGGDSRTVRFAVGGDVQTYNVTDVSRLEFTSSPTESSERRERRSTILRPERPMVSQNTAPAAIEIPSGTAISVRMIDDVDSQRDDPGKTYRATIDEPVVVNGQTLVTKSSDVVVKLVDDKESGKLTGKTELTLSLVSVVVNGRPVDVNTHTISQVSDSRGKKTATMAGGGAALGAIIGAIAGGGKGAAIGAASGAGAGTAVQVMTKGQRVRIPSETILTFTLQQPVRV